jgi:hypothetical protein
MNKNKYQTLFRVTQRDSGSIASSPCPAIFADRRVHIPITLIVFIIYVLFKIKLYLLLVHCLFERFVNMYLFSLFFNYHTCCALVLLFGTNCLYECWNNCQLFAIRHAWYNAFVNLQCIIQCGHEIMKSLLVWPTVLFEATIFVRMMHWSCDTFILEKIKGKFFM